MYEHPARAEIELCFWLELNTVLKKREKVKLIKAETHDATKGCDTSPRQVAATNRLVGHVEIIVAATDFCRCDLSHEFKLV